MKAEFIMILIFLLDLKISTKLIKSPKNIQFENCFNECEKISMKNNCYCDKTCLKYNDCCDLYTKDCENFFLLLENQKNNFYPKKII